MLVFYNKKADSTTSPVVDFQPLQKTLNYYQLFNEKHLYHFVNYI